MIPPLIVYHPYRNLGEQGIVEAFVKGLKKHNQPFRVISKFEFNPDQIDPEAVVFTGRLASSHSILHACLSKGARFIYFDKGYVRRGWGVENKGYIRFSVDGLHPLSYFQQVARPPDRWNRLKITMKPRLKKGAHVIFAGCTSKFANFHDFDPVDYARTVVDTIKRWSGRPVLYRPKPGERNSPVDNPIEGTTLSNHHRTIEEELKNAHALVTFSSNAAIDAILAGVPAFVLGPGIAKPISNTDLSRIENPLFPSEKERRQFFYDLAYCQWNGHEIETGLVWENLKEILLRTGFGAMTPAVSGLQANNSSS